MITQESITSYKGPILSGNGSCLYIPPHRILQPYIANYTVSFPTPQTMPDEYTILPTASSTLVITVNAGKIDGNLRGVNTRAFNAGAYANKMKLLLLIEFHAGGLYPFMPVNQTELVDSSYPLNEIDKSLMQSIEYELEQSRQIGTLIKALDRMFISRLTDSYTRFDFSPVMKNIVKQHGNVTMRDISFPFYYSERQTRRLFLRHVGINPRKLARIVRANYALQLIKKGESSFLDVMEETGYFDHPHFIHEFRAIHGITPREFRRNMSVFYNDDTKM